MKKALIAMGLALLVLFAFPNTAQAQDCKPTTLGTVCVNLVGQDISVTLLGQEIVRIPAPIKEVQVNVPGPRVTIPGPTINVPVPGPTRTIQVPGVSRPQPTVTITVDRSGQIVPPRVTVTPTTSPQASVGASSRTVSPTVTESPNEHVKEKGVRITVPQAVGISLGVLAFGIIAGLIAVYLAYASGYKDSEQAELKAWDAFRNEILGSRKH